MGVNEMKVEEEGKELWMESFWMITYQTAKLLISW